MKIAYITRTVFGAMGTAASYMFPREIAKVHDVMVLSPHDPNSGETVVFDKNRINVIDTYDPDPNEQLALTHLGISYCFLHASGPVLYRRTET